MGYILVVEDDIDCAEILSIHLKSQNLPVQHLSNGNDVIPFIEASEPALIFMDVNLPDNDGRVLCQIIKNRLGESSPPIIMMTAEGKSFKDTALTMGADSFLSKPILADKVKETLTTYLTAE